jgi:hypothetical protein
MRGTPFAAANYKSPNLHQKRAPDTNQLATELREIWNERYIFVCGVSVVITRLGGRGDTRGGVQKRLTSPPRHKKTLRASCLEKVRRL